MREARLLEEKKWNSRFKMNKTIIDVNENIKNTKNIRLQYIHDNKLMVLDDKERVKYSWRGNDRVTLLMILNGY